MSGPPPTLRAFIAGVSGSGKSTRAWDMYLQRFPRRILLDFTGEWAPRAELTAESPRQLGLMVRQLASRGRWTVRLLADPEHMPELSAWLVPVPHLEDCWVRECGGVALLIDEIDLVAGPGQSGEAVRTLYRRSRHAGLSVVSCTTGPSNVSREVSRQCNRHMLAMSLTEPRDRDYMVDAMQLTRQQVSQWQAWTRVHPHGGLWKDVERGSLLWLPERGPGVVDAPAALPPVSPSPPDRLAAPPRSSGGSVQTPLAPSPGASADPPDSARPRPRQRRPAG